MIFHSLSKPSVFVNYFKQLSQQLSKTAYVRHSSVLLTSQKYPDVKRGKYGAVDDSVVTFFEKLLPGRALTDETALEGHNTDWPRNCKGMSKVVLKPKTTEEVSEILKYCNTRKLAVCPQGGNTGLVGGGVPVFDEVVVSTSLMKRIIDVDKVSGIITIEAGCVLEDLNNQLEEHGLLFPLDLGSKGSCQIGGNLSTNAGGIRYLRYGSLHGSTLGLEAVLANGQVLDCLSALRKDNTGYDLKQLFIGSEGTLGIITKAVILCAPRPKAVNAAWVGVSSFNDVIRVFKEAKSGLGEIISAFEFMDAESIESVERTLSLKNPLQGSFPFYCLVETSGSRQDHDEEKLNTFLQKIFDDKIILDGTVASDSAKVKGIWALRERVAEVVVRDGYGVMYDVSLPLDVFYDVVPMLRDRLAGKRATVTGFGHIGDGNLHINLNIPEYDSDTMGIVEPFLFEWSASQRGSISAEHGLGFKKRSLIHLNKSPVAIELMKNMKKMLDPNGILNPYKVLPE